MIPEPSRSIDFQSLADDLKYHSYHFLTCFSPASLNKFNLRIKFCYFNLGPSFENSVYRRDIDLINYRNHKCW